MAVKKETKKKTDIEQIEFVNETPAGEFKDMSKEMLNSYHPPAVEAAWYSWWEKQGFFKADEKDTTKETFVIMLPPPNVTGSLHVGHALTGSIQDSIVRWNRMHGKNVLYLPGIDHAGIATQVVVEKRLFNETGKTRHDLGRDAFIDKVWEWKEEFGRTIVDQLERTGSSLDWSREVFTMDPKMSRAVTEAFVRMYEKGYIYRDTRLVNWDCTLHTAISNIEVEHVELDKPTKLSVPGYGLKRFEFGNIWSFAYKVEGTDEEIIVSTTRPETMLGDTAVAVHPEDPRYKAYHGKYLIHPFNGRRIPIITDAVLVQMEFGTGAVKITPAHDPNDFECGKRHNLDFINILNDDGTLNENGFPFVGMKRFDARVAVLAAFKEKGIDRGVAPNKMSIGLCSRSNDVIEPMIKPQWFVNTDTLAPRALEAARSGELKIVPEKEQKTWARWLEQNQPWCISRQLWWGHRIPAYLVQVKGQPTADASADANWVVARTEEEALQKAAQNFGVSVDQIELRQDEDVLDTWFSSGLFPFSSLGWPDQTDDLKLFFPGHLLETGGDILFFWVARMVMMSLALMDQLPFREVFLHSLVRDKFGEKMSKSSGNVLDPRDCIEGISLEALHEKLHSGNLSKDQIEKAKKGQKAQFPDGIPQCGTDALRFTLLNYTYNHGSDINLDIMRVFGYRTFCNKLWNATKFCLMNLQGFSLERDNQLPIYEDLEFADKWILSRLNNAIKECDIAFKSYDMNRYTEAVHTFFLKELCDVYLEWSKPVMNADTAVDEGAKKRKFASQHTLYTCLEQGFRLLHPAMPFLTEELWQRLPARETVPHDRRSIMINPYPTPVAEWDNVESEKEMAVVSSCVERIRSVKGAYTLTNRQRPDIFITSRDNFAAAVLTREASGISALAYAGPLKVMQDGEQAPLGCGVEVIDDNTEVNVMLRGLIDFAKEVEKLNKQKAKIEQQLDGLVKRAEDPDYEKKVPQRVREQNQITMDKQRGEIKLLDEAIAKLAQLVGA